MLCLNKYMTFEEVPYYCHFVKRRNIFTTHFVNQILNLLATDIVNRSITFTLLLEFMLQEE